MNHLLLKKHLIYWSLIACSILFFAISANAASQGPSGRAFYKPPTPLPSGNHGDLIWYREVPAAVPADAPNTKAWKVMYYSTDGVGVKNIVTGIVFVPKDAWEGNGDRPIISYAVGTHGLCQDCAPSIQHEEGTDYETANIVAALNQGYAVLVTDNPGYTTGSLPSYMVGVAQGHAVLDIVKAATQIPGASIDSDAKVGIWGFSEGGQSASWAGQLKASYLNSINLVGVAAGGIPADLIETGHFIDGKVGSAFLLMVVMGLYSQYPEQIPLYDLANAQGLAAIEHAKTICMFEALFDYMYLPLSSLVNGNPSLDELIETYVEEELESQKLGGIAIAAPVYLYHGTADEFIPLDPALDLKEDYCDKGVKTEFAVYPSEHVVTLFQAAPHVLAWMADRFDGVVTTGTCSSTKPRPVMNNNPTDEDFIVTLDEWKLDAWVRLKTLAQTIYLPKTSTFSADTNMTQESITGSLYVPKFIAPVRVGMPLKIRMLIEPAQDMTGDVSLDDDGILHVHGTAYTNIKIQGLGVTNLAVMPFFLETSEVVEFPIDFDGPVSSLGNGNLTFSGTTSFPKINGGLFAPLFTSLMSGEGQTYSYTVSPPDPTSW